MINSLKKMDVKDIKGLFFDIDDTFTSNGKIISDAYASLWRLKEAGKIVVPITGRPAGWCDHIARMWPVDAVVGENGAFYFIMKGGKLVKEYTASLSEQIMYKKKLENIRDEILQEVPGSALASDQNYREFDLAIDFCEDVKKLDKKEVDKIARIFKKYGANTKVSSIHVNGWFGGYDKLTTTKRYTRKELGIDLSECNSEFVFCGDSPNDEPMFDYFEKSVGVRNVLEFEDEIKSMPKFVTQKESGEGFKELVDFILG